MGDKLWHLDEIRWPSMSVLMKTRRDPVNNTVFKHLEDEKIPDWVEVTSADSTTGPGAVNFTIANYSRLLAEDLLFNPRTGMRASVVATPTTATVSANMGIGSISTANAVGDKLLIYSNANAEDSSARSALSTQKTLKTFHTQWFRHSSSLTWDEADIKLYATNRDRLYQIQQITRRHKEQISYSYFFGVDSADITVAASQATQLDRRSAGGMEPFITTNVWAVPSGHLTRPGLWDALAAVLQYNKDATQIFMATSNRVINIIQGWGWDMMMTQMSDSGQTFGMEFPSMMVGGKKIVFVHEPIFDEEENLQGTALIYDMGKCLYRPFVGAENRDTKLYPNIKTDNNPHVYTDEIATHAGFEFFMEPSFMKITGIEF